MNFELIITTKTCMQSTEQQHRGFQTLFFKCLIHMDTFKAKLVSTEAFQTGHTLVTYTCFASRICISLWVVQQKEYCLTKNYSQTLTHTRKTMLDISLYLYVYTHAYNAELGHSFEQNNSRGRTAASLLAFEYVELEYEFLPSLG